jgi:hypothetical protein
MQIDVLLSEAVDVDGDRFDWARRRISIEGDLFKRLESRLATFGRTRPAYVARQIDLLK